MAPIATNMVSEKNEISELEKELKGRPILLLRNVKASQHKHFPPILVVLVGLPARGKTVIGHKLNRYLNWIGYKTKVFRISEYRRKRIEQYDSHDFFRADNKEAMEIRNNCALDAMEDAAEWLNQQGDVAILDGTNATHARRHLVHNLFAKKMGCRVLFIESIIDDDKIVEKNVKEIMKHSTDYKEMSEEKARKDYLLKIEHYTDQYESIDSKLEGHYSYIKVINAGDDVSAHKLTGHLSCKILYFLSNIRPFPKTLYFSRHGESEFNMLGKIGGDADLSSRGQMYGMTLASHINEAAISGLRVWTSEKRRTIQTAKGINAPMESLEALNELDAGVCEGLTYEEMQEKYPQEFAWRDQDKLRYRYPWGESYVDIMERLEPILIELERESNILVVSHQAVLRCMLGYFLNKKPDDLPYMDVPLHTIIKLNIEGYSSNIEFTKLPVECVSTYRKKPKNCDLARTAEDALLTVPSHFDSLNLWKQQTDILAHEH